MRKRPSPIPPREPSLGGLPWSPVGVCEGVAEGLSDGDTEGLGVEVGDGSGLTDGDTVGDGPGVVWANAGETAPQRDSSATSVSQMSFLPGTQLVSRPTVAPP